MYLLLTVCIIDIIDGQRNYPWDDHEKGHLQTILNYMINDGVPVNGSCKDCNESGWKTSRLHSVGDLMIFEVANGTLGSADTDKFFFPETLVVYGNDYKLVSRYSSSNLIISVGFIQRVQKGCTFIRKVSVRIHKQDCIDTTT